MEIAKLLEVLIPVLGTLCATIVTAVIGPVAIELVKRRSKPTPSAEPELKAASPPVTGDAPSPVMPLVSKSREIDFSILSIVSLVIGVISLCAWMFPICGLPANILGLIFGIYGVGLPRHRGLAIAGIVLCVVGLIASTANSAIGAYMGYHGQLNFQQPYP